VVELPETVPAGQIEMIILIPILREEPIERASAEDLKRWDAAAAELAGARPFRELTLKERRARLHRLRGIGKGLLPSSEEFLSQKHEEVEIEERKFAR
jgi:hypothetical protein